MNRPLVATLSVLAACTLLVASCKATLTAEDGGLDPSDASAPDASATDAALADGDPGRDAAGRDAGQVDASPSDGGDGGGDAGACGLPQMVGPCDAAIPRFWFNASAGRCERFIYGGCGANANNFQSIEECAAACAPAVANPCTITQCGGGQQCVFQGTKPRCASPCDDAGTCASPETCSCGASCAGCRDCSRVCF